MQMMKIQIICRVWSPGSPPFFGCLSISWFNWIFESHANFFCNLIGRGLDDPEIGDMPSWWPHSLACPLLPRCTTGCPKSMFRLYPKCPPCPTALSMPFMPIVPAVLTLMSRLCSACWWRHLVTKLGPFWWRHLVAKFANFGPPDLC